MKIDLYTGLILLELILIIIILSGLFSSNQNNKIKRLYRPKIYKIFFSIFTLLVLAAILTSLKQINIGGIDAKFLSLSAFVLFIFQFSFSWLSSSSKKRYIFYVIDDEPDILDIMSMYLEDLFDCETKLFSSVESAMTHLKSLKGKIGQSIPDIIISDISMPTGSGLMFPKKLQEADIKIPLIFITGLGGDEIGNKELIVLDKTVDPETLKKTILETISKFKSEKKKSYQKQCP